ncbi:unnamed protein product [Meganyctiphanes norvegica]|uniref:Uncharacterized protein n=1 Tax=Meganyctiphanes norvegica TaxID=48144 RepID=A0AAV2SYU6_MEGNR
MFGARLSSQFMASLWPPTLESISFPVAILWVNIISSIGPDQSSLNKNGYSVFKSSMDFSFCMIIDAACILPKPCITNIACSRSIPFLLSVILNPLKRRSSNITISFSSVF